MFSIAPIGSCRIATPLRLAKKDYGFSVNHTRNYGFCHSSAEAVQLMRFMKGDLEPPATIWPLIARGVDREAMLAEAPQPADMHVIEISSAKRLSVGDYCIQLNYFVNEFRAFFADKSRGSQFWAACRTDDQATIDAFLAQNWVGQPDHDHECLILRQVRINLTTEAEMRADIRTLMQALPQVLFVTHVNALKPSGEPIASRAGFIEAVACVVAEEGGLLYNPTARMLEIGQETAIEDFSDSLAHFTEEFSRIVFADWFDLAISAGLDRSVAGRGSAAVRNMLVPHVDAMLLRGNLDDLDNRLTRLAAVLEDSLEMTAMRVRVAFGRGDREAAYGIASRAARVFPVDGSILWLQGEAAFATGRHAETATIYRALIAMGQPPSALQVLSLANALKGQGDAVAAISFFDTALLLDPGLEAAAQGLVELAVAQSPDFLARMALPRRAEVAALVSPLLRLKLALSVGSDADLAAIRSALHALGARELAAMLTYLTSAHRIDLGAEFLETWRIVHDGLNPVDAGLRAVVDSWFSAVAREPSFGGQTRLLRTILRASPLHGPSRIALRNLRREVLNRVRDLYQAQDLDGLNHLATEVADLPEPMPELDVFRARLRFGAGDYVGAMALGKTAADHLPGNISIWSLLMRCAGKLNDLVGIDLAAHKVIELSDADTERLEIEARDRLERLPALCFRAAESEPDALRQYQLLRIARRDDKLTQTCDNRLARLAAQLMTTLRTLEVGQASGFLPLATTLRDLLGDNERILTSIGRYHVKQKDFARALPCWQSLTDLVPANTDYQFQLGRCQDRLAPGQPPRSLRPTDRHSAGSPLQAVPSAASC